MTLRLAIVADDLTGALDTATPFALAGLKVVVAVSVDGVEDAIATKADVVAVNTASRALDATAAVESVTRAMAAIMRARPAILFKKVDSRLKGNPGAEADAVADAGGRRLLVVAPAVPDQGRQTQNGRVVGRGVDAPIAIAPQFADAGRAVDVVDAAVEAESRHAGGADRLERSRRRRRTRARPRPCEAHGRDGARRSLPSDAVDALRPR